MTRSFVIHFRIESIRIWKLEWCVLCGRRSHILRYVCACEHVRACMGVWVCGCAYASVCAYVSVHVCVRRALT